MKKSDIFNITEKEFEDVFESIKTIFLGSDKPIPQAIKNELMPKYENTKFYPAAIYIIGEMIGKLEMGVNIINITLVMQDYIETKQDTDLTDQLLKKYKKKVVN